MNLRQELTRVKALEGVQGGGGGQLEGQRGQDVLLPEDVRLALAQGQDLGGLVQVDVGVDRQGSHCLLAHLLAIAGLPLLLEALQARLSLACTSSLCIPSHLKMQRGLTESRTSHLSDSLSRSDWVSHGTMP